MTDDVSTYDAASRAFSPSCSTGDVRVNRSAAEAPPRPARPADPSDELGDWGGDPHRTLLVAVLQLAVTDVVAGPNRNPRRFVDARDWVLTDDVLWPFSFLNICEALDLDPDRLRAHLGTHLTVLVPVKHTSWYGAARGTRP